MIDAQVMYSSIRQEILDQKKCQFNIFGASITLTAAVLAYGASTNIGPLIYLAPILLNVLAATMILDKATSIQRMVGYLQLMESRFDEFIWMWEYHLAEFRKVRATFAGLASLEGFRRHSYVVTVATILFVVNILCAGLYRFGPAAINLRSSTRWSELAEFYGAVNLIVMVLLVSGLAIMIYRWGQLMFGRFTGASVRARWLVAIEDSRRRDVGTRA